MPWPVRCPVAWVLAVVVAAACEVAPVSGRYLQDSALNVSEVVWQHEVQDAHAKNAFLGSPSLLRLRSGLVLTSHDFFFLNDGEEGRVVVYASPDDGVSWRQAATVSGVYWAQLWQGAGDNDDVFLIGTSGDDTGYSSITMAKCAAPCNGSVWTAPAVLFPGNATQAYHCGPQPVVHANGTYYRAFEARGTVVPNGNLAPVVVSAKDTCADLLSPACWRMSPPLLWNASWPGLNYTDASRTWEEANAFLTADGAVMVAVRLDKPLSANCHSFDTCNGAALLAFDAGTNTLSFVRRIPLPSGCNKFTIHWNAADAAYYALTNPVLADGYSAGTCGQRNVLIAARSPALVSWSRCSTVLYDDTGLQPADSLRYTGFQYVMWDWKYGSDSLTAEYLARSGYRGATTYHDANRMLYGVVEDMSAQC